MSEKHSKKSRSSKGSKKYYTILDKEYSFQVTEAFKTLRTNLIFSLSTKKNKVFAVTSAIQHEGKSTTAANLALTFAQMDAKVLLIDADLRKPVQNRLFKLKNKLGLSTLLCGLNSFKEVLNENVIPGLDVLTSGAVPPNPSELLASENMKVLFKELSEYYDYIIVDTPPVNIVSDTIALTDSIAGVVLVAMSGVTTYDSYQRAVDSINYVGGSVLGAVVTKVPSSTSKYGKRRKYGSTYEYSYAYKEN